MNAFEGIIDHPTSEALKEILEAAKSVSNFRYHQLGQPQPEFHIRQRWEARQSSLMAAGFLTYEMFEEVVCRVCLD